MTQWLQQNKTVKDENMVVNHVQKYIDQMRDESIPYNDRHLKKLLKDEDAETQNSVLTYLHKEAKDELLPQLLEHRKEIYLAMRESGQWGPLGEQRITISFCRNLLNIPAAMSVSDMDSVKMNMIMAELHRKLGNKSGEELIQYCKERPIVLFGETYTSFYKLENFIYLLDAPYYFYSSSGPLLCGEFIFGPVEWDSFGDIKIYTFTKEWARSPAHALCFAARAPNGKLSNSFMHMRDEAFQCIFYNKYWRSFDDKLFFEFLFNMEHPTNAIRDGFKKAVLNFCGINSQEDIEEMYPDQLFNLLDMKAGVILHELGHYIYTKFDRTSEDKAIFDTFRTEDNVLLALEELLGDWAPQHDTMEGSLLHFAKIGMDDAAEAALQYYIYESDNWFPDADEPDFLVLRSHTMVSLVLAFVNDDKFFDCGAIIDEHPGIYKFLVDRQQSIIHGVRDIIYNASYENETKTYSDVESALMEDLKKNGTTGTVDEIRQKYTYWDKLRTTYVKPNPELWKCIQDFLSSQGSILERDMLQLIHNILQKRKHTKTYNSVFEFIVKRCKEIDVYGWYDDNF